MQNRSVLILANMLSRTHGTRGVGEELACILEAQGWSVKAASSRRGRVIRLLDMLISIWRWRREYAVVYLEVYSGLAFLWAEACSYLLWLLKKPVVIVLHGGNLPILASKWPWRISRLFRLAQKITTPSRYLQSSLAGFKHEIILLPNAIDLSSYTFCRRREAAPKLAWLRAFHAIYSPETAAESLVLLVDEFPEIELVMYGPDKEDGSLDVARSVVERAGISAKLHALGPIPKVEVPLRLALYDIFLNTTTAESFGISVVEAAALGMCIVTTNVGELPYIWTHEHDALLVPPNDPQAMADAIRRILTEPGLAERLSRNARTTAEQFDWAIVLPQWESLLLDVIEKHKYV